MTSVRPKRKIKRKPSMAVQVWQLHEDIRWLKDLLYDRITRSELDRVDSFHRHNFEFLLEEHRKIAESLCKLALVIEPASEEYKEALKRNEKTIIQAWTQFPYSSETPQ